MTVGYLTRSYYSVSEKDDLKFWCGRHKLPHTEKQLSRTEASYSQALKSDQIYFAVQYFIIIIMLKEHMK